MQISQFFVNGDIKGAIAYMRDHEAVSYTHLTLPTILRV